MLTRAIYDPDANFSWYPRRGNGQPFHSHRTDCVGGLSRVISRGRRCLHSRGYWNRGFDSPLCGASRDLPRSRRRCSSRLADASVCRASRSIGPCKCSACCAVSRIGCAAFVGPDRRLGSCHGIDLGDIGAWVNRPVFCLLQEASEHKGITPHSTGSARKNAQAGKLNVRATNVHQSCHNVYISSTGSHMATC